MGDVGARVSATDKDALTSTGKDLLLSSYPLTKLDVSKTVSFQNINLIFINDPPEPPGLSGTLNTQVYSFAHGYSYVPATWFLIQVITSPVGSNFTQNYFQDNGIIGAHTAFDEATFYAKTDVTNVYFYVGKTVNSGLGGVANNLVNTRLKIRSYVFTEDVGV